jgi:hypothetical protein
MQQTRASLVFLLWAVVGISLTAGPSIANAGTGDLNGRFGYLSAHGNSSCSQSFMNSIAAMPASTRLQGSCCSPMVLERYVQQVHGLMKYANVPEIPPDPYDVQASLAVRMIAAYDVKLKATQQAAYDYAMQHSNEHGPCCCRCWRWHAYGGLAKLLIRDRGFTGRQVAEVWNLSDGCGGAS